jgi:ABC-2 type transport system ATP-binding protein
MQNSILKVENLSAGYDGKKIVNDVSFEVGEGKIFGLLGLNGAGKTTLIKTILNLRQKISGKVDLINSSQIAYLPEKFEPPYFLTGEKFIQFSLKMYGKSVSADDIRSKAESISFNPEFLKKNVKTYSKGMRQKIGLLATIMSDCNLIILDEPMSGLDPKARVEIKNMILNSKKKGQSIFMSSHILSDIQELCDEVAIFHNNSIVFKGTPDQMMSKGNNKNSIELSFLNIIENT